MFRIASSVFLCLALFGFIKQSALALQDKPGNELQVGPAEGDKAPAFKARDQFGKDQDNKSVAGTGGTVLLFFRSADW